MKAARPGFPTNPGPRTCRLHRRGWSGIQEEGTFDRDEAGAEANLRAAVPAAMAMPDIEALASAAEYPALVEDYLAARRVGWRGLRRPHWLGYAADCCVRTLAEWGVQGLEGIVVSDRYGDTPAICP